MSMQCELLAESMPVFAAGSSPVFGVAASWICYRRGIYADYDDARTGKRPPLPDPSEYADVAFLYLSRGTDQGWRVVCPAINYDQTGEFGVVWSRFIQAADKAAAARTGLVYGWNRDEPRLCDSLITAAWQGETAAEKAGKQGAVPLLHYC